jgi:hypothetical protein
MGARACVSCNATIDDAAHFCPSCGRPVRAAHIEVLDTTPAGDLTASHAIVESRRSSRPLLLGVVAVLVAAAVLAVSRGGDGEPAEAAEDDATTTLPPEPTTTTTPLAPATTTTVPDPDDVSAKALEAVANVPEALRDHWLLLVDDTEVVALDLSNGARVTIEDHEIGRVEEIADAGDRGFVVVSEVGAAKLVDWTLDSSIGIGFGLWTGAIGVTEESIWITEDELEGSVLVRIDERARRTDVRALPSFMRVVGSADGSALVAGFATPGLFRVAPDGRTDRVDDATAFVGGEEWYVAWSCDDALDCGSELVDLRTGRRVDVDVPIGPVEAMERSHDDRRALLQDWSGPTGGLLLVDADEMTVTRVSTTLFDATEVTADSTLDHVVASVAGTEGMVVIDLATGERSTLPIDRGRIPVLTPEGWVPPTTDDGAQVEAAGP